METALINARPKWRSSAFWRDFVLFVSVMPLLWGLSHADWVDRFALVLLIIGTALLRFVRTRKPLSSEQLAF
jgi:hypothetical protein